MIRILMAMCLLTVPALGAECTRAEGEVLFDGKPMEKGFVFDKPGELATGANATAVIRFSSTDSGASEVLVNPQSRLKIDPAGKQEQVLFGGSLRARLKDKAGKKSFSVRTASSVMAVRGTDFLAVFQPLLSESEIVVFDGKVQFSSTTNPKDTKEIPQGHWGGIGGRYGKKIGPLIRLPKNALSHFDTSTRF